MRRFALIASLLIGLCVPASSQWNGCPAGFCAPISANISNYQGPGDVVSGAKAWGSPARAYNAAYANGTNPLADLVDSAAPTVVICTLRVKTSGFVDLTSAYCTGSVTPAVKCAAATGGTCNISKVYDQIGGTGGWSNATAAAQPKLTFSALGSLPGMTSVNASNTQLNSSSYTTTLDNSSYIVLAKRTGSTGVATAGLGSNSGGTTFFIGFDATANNARFGTTGGLDVIEAATDNAFHYIQGTEGSGGNQLIVDGALATTVGSLAALSNGSRMFRTGGGNSLDGVVMEVGIWDTLTFNSTQYGLLNTNAHSATSGYNF